MNKLIFVGLFVSTLSACCFGPQYRTPVIPTAAPVQALPPTRAVVIDNFPDFASGKVSSNNLNDKTFNAALVRIEIPATVNRGDNMFVGVFPPTEAELEEVIAVVGIANYLTLNKQPDTSFTGYFRVPELFDPGQYTMSFFFRTKDNKRRVLQRLLTIQ